MFFYQPQLAGHSLHARPGRFQAHRVVPQCCTHCFHQVSSPNHTPMAYGGGGDPEFGNGDRRFLPTNSTRLFSTNSKTDSALTSNRILYSFHAAGARGCVYHPDARSALMTFYLRYARRHRVPDTADAIQYVTESLWRYLVNQDAFPQAITAAQDEAIGQGLTSEGLVIAQVGVKILCEHRRCHEMNRGIDYLPISVPSMLRCWLLALFSRRESE